MLEVGISLGSNTGDRLALLTEARSRLAALPGTHVLASSRLYETEPVDVKPRHRQMKFLNACVILTTTLNPDELATEAHRIETELGRARTEDDRHAPRTLDLDLIYAGAEVIDLPELTVPHPRWAVRRFVVQPLCDVRPDLVLPGQARSVAEILAGLPATPGVVLFRKTW